MVLKNTAYKVGIAVFCLSLLAPQARAEGTLAPLNINARYNVAWSGIVIGRIILHGNEDAGSYSLSVDTKTHGLGSLITDESSMVTAHGAKKPDGTYVPAAYDSGPQKAGDTRRDITHLVYNAEGNIEKRTREPEDDPAWRPPVKFADIDTARDPITAGFILRKALHDAIDTKTMEVSNRTYDGARLATMKFTRTANAKVEVMDTYRDTIDVQVTRTPITGYTPKELKKFNKGDPEIHLYFSNDDAFLPVRASAKVLLGELSLTMVDDKAN
jgi:hypothetical protein